MPKIEVDEAEWNRAQALTAVASKIVANPAARKGLLRVMQHLGAQTELRIARSPWGKDFNDAIRAGTA